MRRSQSSQYNAMMPSPAATAAGARLRGRAAGSAAVAVVGRLGAAGACGGAHTGQR
ncbi:MAG TPA: hypothetical protein VNV87_05055 [Acidimicrobiales bacterium]|nr:hypothetical protein [Acidimicrobiales bacterium]